jgi:dienelactone hydrolase
LRGVFTPRLAAAVLFGFLIGGAPAEADERVNFPGASQSDPIQGYLSKPKGAGSFPAVVLLHTCLGLPAERVAIGERIAAWGYAALFVDDFATRSLKETCAVDFNPALSDAYGALAYLSHLPYIDPARIAAVGFSQGGDTALKIAAGGAAGFKAAAAFYAPCANRDGAVLQIPTLILVGAKDEVTPARDCAALAKRQQPGMVKLVVYPGAAHAFDLPEFNGSKQVLGMSLAYDGKAARRSWGELRSFLAARLKR